MSSLFRKKDWKNSPGHLLLLTHFIQSGAIPDYEHSEYWENVLKESPSKALNRFVNEGIIELAGLHKRIDYRFKVSELRSILKDLDLKLTGRKEELIERLVEHNGQEMRKATRDIAVYTCTKEGIQLAQDYLSTEKARRAKAEDDIHQHLEKRELSEAMHVVYDYEKASVFPRGLNIDWDSKDISDEITMVGEILEQTPRILANMESNRLSALRIPAAMMYLWGTNRASSWLDKDFETGITLDGDSACRMLLFFARFKRDLRSYRRANVKTIKIVCCDDSCAECKKLGGRCYNLESVPELPYSKCTNKLGCRCVTVLDEFL
jgi:hypothetical protein